MIDAITQTWFRNVSDERAVENGCRFDVLRGAWTVYWIERYCRLYEGEGYAGEPLVLWGCRECDHSEFYAAKKFDEDAAQERARLFSECVAAGHQIDWQYECVMRLFGWVRNSEKWRRDVRRFRQGSIWLPKKSKKSPSLAAIGMYLTAGDGEPGQKVFLAAKDGNQARDIAGKHAVEMYLQSADLRREFTLNRNLMQLTHENSRSFLKPLSSANSQTQESKEGLNGSILIDETHVVDRAFVDRISRAGISRSEPLMLEFSTAGNNPDSYGKSRFDEALDIISGKRIDEEFFAMVYAAPQDVTDEDLERDLDFYVRLANPALGHTIEAAELRRDYERSKETVEKLALFKMYRLNIWQQSSNPWLKIGDWQKCAAEYTEEDLLGKTCFGAFDLSLKWDTTAFVLLFPWGDKDGQPRFRLWVYFFLPEVSARKTGSKVSWFDWEKRGHITLTDGNVTDFPLVRRTIVHASKKFDLQSVAYDDRFAEYFAQELQDQEQINVKDFDQTITNFIEPMGLFEQDVISGRLEHPNNLCLNWQASNVAKNRKGMLVKPELDDVKKIDGITAAVMAREMAANADKPSVYDTRGVLTIGGSEQEKREVSWATPDDWDDDECDT